jgi:hypothetical protein
LEDSEESLPNFTVMIGTSQELGDAQGIGSIRFHLILRTSAMENFRLSMNMEAKGENLLIGLYQKEKKLPKFLFGPFKINSSME